MSLQIILTLIYDFGLGILREGILFEIKLLLKFNCYKSQNIRIMLTKQIKI